MQNKKSSVKRVVNPVGQDGPASGRAISDVRGEESVSATEGARALNVSARSFRRICSTGRIPHFRTREGYIRVWRKDLAAYIDGSADPSSAVSTRLSAEREQVQALSLQLQQRR